MNKYLFLQQPFPHHKTVIRDDRQNYHLATSTHKLIKYSPTSSFLVSSMEWTTSIDLKHGLLSDENLVPFML